VDKIQEFQPSEGDETPFTQVSRLLI